MTELDHLLWGCPELEAGVAEFAARTGVHPRAGGSHPGLGTHNALVALDGGRYLELIARDPAQAGTGGAFVAWFEGLAAPRLITFAMRTTDAAEIAAQIRATGLEVTLLSGERTTPAGDRLTWRNVMVGGHAYGRVFPFFLEWGAGTAHPSTTAPAGCALGELTVEHPEAGPLGRLFAAFDIPVEVAEAPSPGIRARLDTPRGTVILD